MRNCPSKCALAMDACVHINIACTYTSVQFCEHHLCKLHRHIIFIIFHCTLHYICSLVLCTLLREEIKNYYLFIMQIKENHQYKPVFYLDFPYYRSSEFLATFRSPRVMNTHIYASCLPEQVTRKQTKVIHVARSPKDVAVSFYHNMKALNCMFDDPPYETFSEFLPYVTGEYGVCE